MFNLCKYVEIRIMAQNMVYLGECSMCTWGKKVLLHVDCSINANQVKLSNSVSKSLLMFLPEYKTDHMNY